MREERKREGGKQGRRDGGTEGRRKGGKEGRACGHFGVTLGSLWNHFGHMKVLLGHLCGLGGLENGKC